MIRVFNKVIVIDLRLMFRIYDILINIIKVMLMSKLD